MIDRCQERRSPRAWLEACIFSWGTSLGASYTRSLAGFFCCSLYRDVIWRLTSGTHATDSNRLSWLSQQSARKWLVLKRRASLRFDFNDLRRQPSINARSKSRDATARIRSVYMFALCAQAIYFSSIYVLSFRNLARHFVECIPCVVKCFIVII